MIHLIFKYLCLKPSYISNLHLFVRKRIIIVVIYRVIKVHSICFSTHKRSTYIETLISSSLNTFFSNQIRDGKDHFWNVKIEPKQHQLWLPFNSNSCLFSTFSLQKILFWCLFANDILILIDSHEDLLNHGLPENYRVASAKLKAETLANPHIILFNSSLFKGKI